MLDDGDLVRDRAVEAGPAHGARAADGVAERLGGHLAVDVPRVDAVVAVGRLDHRHRGVVGGALGERAGEQAEVAHARTLARRGPSRLRRRGPHRARHRLEPRDRAARWRRGLAEAGCDVVLHGRDGAAVARSAGRARRPARGVRRHRARGGRTRRGRGRPAGHPRQQRRHPAPRAAARAGHGRLAAGARQRTSRARSWWRARPPAGWWRAGRGKIVNIASLQAELARPGIAAYAAAKGGLRMLTRGMCAEWGPAGVQVNAIAPGYFATDLTRALVEDEAFSALGPRAHARGPVGTRRGARRGLAVPRVAGLGLRLRPDALRRRGDVGGRVSRGTCAPAHDRVIRPRGSGGGSARRSTRPARR